MGKHCGSWLHHQFFPWKSHSINCKSALPEMGDQDVFPTNPYSSTISMNGPLPGFDLSHLKTGHANGSRWIYSLSQQSKGVAPLTCTVSDEKLPTPCNCYQEPPVNATPGSLLKRFVVFDQSCNGNNLVFSSTIESPYQHPNLGDSTQYGNFDSHQDKATRSGLASHLWPVVSEGLEENREINEGSEMREDSEELDALLYSDGDSDYEDDETSTGHSPSEIIGHQQKVELSAENFASAKSGMKRKRLEEHDPSLMDTASSSKHSKLSDNEAEAESSRVDGMTQLKLDMSWANKRSKRDKIQDTVSILQSMVPGGAKGKDAVYILDQAIHYLKSLKLKAKSLGVTLN